jgi:hypothetical protein
MANISQFHGEISKCDCGLADHPEGTGERACVFCYGRGFVAACKGCNGTGKHEVAVNGTDKTLGVMSSTCSLCGGKGKFGVNRPKDWVDAPKEEAIPEVAAVA